MARAERSAAPAAPTGRLGADEPAIPRMALPAPSAADSGIVAVATSGGRDSTALLHATARAAAGTGLRVVALHVHHGLSAFADDWLDHVRAQCRRWARAGLPLAFDVRRVQGEPAPGQSIEAWARRARYDALAEMAQEAGASCVLLAHHRRDQAETVLLQLLRGAGPAGLAAMPVSAQRAGLTWSRPWLAQRSEAIDAYVRRWRLTHIEDDSNADTRFARNRLRHEVWPALRAAFPDVETALAHAARQQAMAAGLIDEIAADDLRAVGEGGGASEGRPGEEQGPASPAALVISRWLALSAPRRHGVLRAWLKPVLAEGVPESLLTRLMDELPGSRAARWPAPAGFGSRLELRLYRGLLHCEVSTARSATQPASGSRGHSALAVPGVLSPRACASAAAAPAPHALDLSQPGIYPLPAWRGTLVVEAVSRDGLACSALACVTLRAREGGEQFQRAPASTPRSLKKQFQAAALPAWQRSGPLVWHGEALLFVPGLGADARQRAAAGTPQCALRWLPDVGC